MLVKEYNTTLVKGIGICFDNNSAFVFQDDKGFFSKEDIEEGVIKAGLLDLPYPVEGLKYLACLNDNHTTEEPLLDILAMEHFVRDVFHTIFRYDETRELDEENLHADDSDRLRVGLEIEGIDPLDDHIFRDILKELTKIDEQPRYELHDLDISTSSEV
jgi:hypothetical protein